MCETTDRIQRAPAMVAYLVETRETLRKLLAAIKPLPAPKEAADGPPPIVRHG